MERIALTHIDVPAIFIVFIVIVKRIVEIAVGRSVFVAIRAIYVIRVTVLHLYVIRVVVFDTCAVITTIGQNPFSNQSV